MFVYEVEDVLRSKFGVADMSPTMLKFIRDAARSEIESKGNFFWQASSADIQLPTSVAAFDVKVDFIVPDFQEFRFLALQKNSKWRFIFPGSWQATLEGVDVAGTGFPERCTYENGVLTVSPIPDDDIEGKLFYFATTSEPEDLTGSTGTDDLYTDWPQLILFQALAVGERLLNKDIVAAKVWNDLAQEQIDKALDYTAKLLGEPRDEMSASAAAKILQAQVGR